MTRIRSSLLAAMLAISTHAWGASSPCFGDPNDIAQITATRAAVETACTCFSFDSPGDFTRCAGAVVNAQVEANLLRRSCKGAVRRIYSRSICGRSPDLQQGPYVPCIARLASGRVTCSVKPLLRCGPDTVPFGSSRCFGNTTCTDAADTNGDLRVSAPGDSGSCTAGSSSFTDNNDGTISDAATGLQWEKKSDDGSLSDKDLCHPWAGLCSGDGETLCRRDVDCAVAGGSCNAGDCITPSPNGSTLFEWLDQLNASTFAGYNDWRIPSIDELVTLSRRGVIPAIDPIFETGCAPGCSVLGCSCTTPTYPLANVYLSSTGYTFPIYCWSAAFHTPSASGLILKTQSLLPARAVRGP